MFFHHYNKIFDFLFPRYTWRKKCKSVYLTFDDGPVPEATLEVLDILKQYGIKATFFFFFLYIKNNRVVFERIIEEGHSIGNHTYNHLNGKDTNKENYINNIKECQRVFKECKVNTSLFRPPHGRMTIGQRKALAKEYEIIMWSVLSGDFSKSVSPEVCLEKALSHTKEGSIVLFHDSVKTIDKVREVLPKYIVGVQAKGLNFKCL